MTSPTIHQAMASILAELPAIGKNQRNQQQGFSFRGVDDVLDALNPLLGKHGVFFVPHVAERVESQRLTGKGGTLWVVNLHVEYTFYGPGGDFVTADGWGEGTDMGDKATQKAMTGAMKYVLFQVFAIATHETDIDSDRTTPDPTNVPPTPPGPALVPKHKRDSLKARCVALQAADISIADERERLSLPLVDSCNAAQAVLFEQMLDDLEAKVVELEKPFEKAEAK